MQYFKGDATELKYYESGEEVLSVIGTQLDLFFAAAYENKPLGGLIYDNGLAPLANAIDRDIFVSSYKEVYDAFVVAGTFESYLAVFVKIFGEDVEVDFTVPASGKLNIDILAAGVEELPFEAREIVENDYVLTEVTDQDDEVIYFQTIKGFKTQYELEQMLFEMVPAGIFTTITLSLL